ncbi:MAG: hypothetical protein ACLP50_04670 [Solirubrobacteraceae bacterium]
MTPPARLGGIADEHEAILFANAPAVQSIVDALLTLVGAPAFVELNARSDRVAIDSVNLARLVLTLGTGPVDVQVVGDELQVSGGSDYMRALAEDLTAYLTHNDLDAPGMHHHLEYYGPPGAHPWLAAEALPLIVAGWVIDEP